MGTRSRSPPQTSSSVPPTQTIKQVAALPHARRKRRRATFPQPQAPTVDSAVSVSRATPSCSPQNRWPIEDSFAQETEEDMEKLKEAETAAAQRLRKTFKYPSESDDEDAVEAGMDEQDRATLLYTLSTHDTSTTHTYTLFLLTLPLLPTLLYIPRLLALSTLPTSLVAVASLLATAYTLYFLPLPPTQMEPIDGVDVTPPTLQQASRGKGKDKKPIGGYGIYNKTPAWEQPTEKSVRRPVPYLSEDMADKIGDYIVPTNRAVCGLLALYEVWLAREWTQGFMIGGGFLPGVICLIILWARTELRIIDMDALEKINAGAAQGKVK